MAVIDLPKQQAVNLQEANDWKDYLGAGLEIGGTIIGGIAGGIAGAAAGGVGAVPGAIGGAALGHTVGALAGSFFKDDPVQMEQSRNAALDGGFNSAPAIVSTFGRPAPRSLPPNPGTGFGLPQVPQYGGMQPQTTQAMSAPLGAGSELFAPPPSAMWLNGPGATNPYGSMKLG